jgi:hypothetical protein
MYEYKVISLETFMEIPEIKNIENKEKYKIGDSDLSRSIGVVNFMQLMFDFMGSDGWEYCGVTKTPSFTVTLFASGKGATFFKGAVDGLIKHATGGVNPGGLLNDGLIETYIFKRQTDGKVVYKNENNAVVEKKPENPETYYF